MVAIIEKRDLRDFDWLTTVLAIAIASFGVGLGLLGEGAFELASRVITAADPGTASPGGLHLSGMLALAYSLIVVV